MARAGRGHPNQSRRTGVIFLQGGGVAGVGRVAGLGPAAPTIILPLPTQRMQTVLVQSVAVAERRRMPRRFALQGWEGSEIRQTQQAVALTFGAAAKQLGPRPPMIILPLPSLRVMTLVVSCCAIKTRLTMPRRQTHYFVRKGIAEPRLTMPDRRLYVQVDLQAVATRIASQLRQPHSKLLVVQVLAQPPPAVVSTISVTLAGRTRADAGRRAPHSLRITPAVYNIPVFSTTVWLAARYRRGHWDLPPPTYISNVTMPQFVAVAIPPTPPFAPILVSTVAPRSTKETYWRRYVEHIYFGPMVVAPAFPVQTTIDVSLTPRARGDLRRRATHYRLAPPTVVTAAAAAAVFSGPDVTLTQGPARLRARIVHSHPVTPAVVEPYLRVPDRRLTILTVIDPTLFTRDRDKRQTHSFLGQGIVEPYLRAPDRRLAIQVDTQAVWTRTSFSRRAPHSRLSPPTVVISTVFYGPAVTLASGRSRALARILHSHLAPPATLEPWSVALQERQIDVQLAGRTRTETIRRGPHSHLYAGIAEPPLQIPDRRLYIQVDTQAVATRSSMVRRLPFSRLYPPATLEAESVAIRERQITVVLAGRTRVEAVRRAPHYTLGKPQASAIYFGPAVTLATQKRLARRPSFSHLSPPAVVEPYIRMPDRRLTILVALAGRTRAELGRRAPHSRLRPGIVEPSLLPSDPRLVLRVDTQAVWTRTGMVRRLPLSRLNPPAIGVTPAAAPVVTTLLVSYVSVRTRTEAIRRAPHSKLRPPAVVEPALLGSDRRLLINVELQSVATRQGMPRRGPNSHLYAPATLEPYSVALRSRTIDTLLNAVPDRIARVRRGPHSHLAPPATLEPESVELREQTITVVLAGRTRVELGRRASHYRLSPPAVVGRSLQPPDRQLTIPTPFAPTPKQPRRTHWFYRGPVTLPVPPVVTELSVTLSYRTRTELQRRASHYTIGEPTALRVFSGPRITLSYRTRTEAQRRASHYAVGKPTALQVFSGPRVTVASVRTRVEAVRRAPHYHLAPPTKINPLANLKQQTLLVVTVAVRRRLEQGRHVVESFLHPPTAILPKADIERQTIRTKFKIAVWNRVDRVRRIPHYVLFPPTVVVPLVLANWRLSPDTNWIFEAAAANDWRLLSDSGWETEPAPGWRIEPIEGWTMEADLP